MVLYPALRVMHMGDLFPGKQIPIMDSNNGGSGLAYAGTLKQTYDGVKAVDTIITGHSTTMTPADLLEFSQFIGEFVNAVRVGHKMGQSSAEIAGAWKVPEKYKGYAQPDPKRLQATIETVLAELK